MVNAYKECPVDSIFPQAYGLNGDANDWTYNHSSEARATSVSLSFDQKYVVTSGYVDWMSEKFLP